MDSPSGCRLYDPPDQQRASIDYSKWSFEELRNLAAQLRLSGIENKTRSELLDLFGGPRSLR
jgi:hypothetical protein